MNMDNNFQVPPEMTIAEFLQTMHRRGLAVARMQQQLPGQPPVMVMGFIGEPVEKVNGILRAHTNYFDGEGGNGEGRIIVPHLM